MEVFEVKLATGEIVKGNKWPAEKAVANLVFITGMQEYAARYDRMARFMVDHHINVWVLDHFGQGLNAPTEDDLQKWPKGAFDKIVDALNLLILEVKKNGLPTIQGGHSMGSFTTQARLERYPLAADKTIIMGSNGGQAGLMSIAAFLAKLLIHKGNWDKPNKFFTNLGLGPYNKQIKNPRTPCDWLSYNEENVDNYLADVYLGHMNTGGFWREFLIGMSQIWKKKNLKKIDKNEKILIVSGEDDPVGQNGKGLHWLEDTYKELGIQDVTLKLYSHMRHEILMEIDYEIVLNDLLEFILA